MDKWFVKMVVCCGLLVGCSQGTINNGQSLTNSQPVQTPKKHQSKLYTLELDKSWQLNAPRGQRFDASGLLFLEGGRLVTLNDLEPVPFQINFYANTNTAELTPLTNVFTKAQLAQFAVQKVGRYDSEGLGRDDQGRLYLSEEGNRWILRFDPKSNQVERLPIDWSEVEHHWAGADENSSFEGVAVGGNRLYVANERNKERIVVVDLQSMKVVDDFAPVPTHQKFGGMHYSDLSWFDGSLYILLRHTRVILKVDPSTHRVLAEYDFIGIERDPEFLYRSIYPTGVMEGLAVDADYFYLVTDNNGQPRIKYPQDIRPTLFRCKRPDK